MTSNEQKLRRLISNEIKTIIKESIRPRRRLTSLIFEAEDAGVAWDSNYASFVQALAGNASDPKVQAFIKAGKLDNDDNDDKFSFSSADLVVAGLIPTQNEIDVDGSLSWVLKDSAAFLNYVKGAGKSFTLRSPIVTYKGKYIVDGHHRWSQLYSCNKDAKISAIDISVEDLEPLDVLKAVQAAIAVQTKSVPMASVEGQNLLEIDRGGLESWLDSFNASPSLFAAVASDAEAMSIMEKVAGTSKNEAIEVSEEDYEKSQQLLGGYIWANVSDMQQKSKPIAGAPKRDFMPQTDDVDWQKPLKQGIVDIVGPHADPEDIKKSLEAAGRKRTGNVMLERWQRLAGIIK